MSQTDQTFNPYGFTIPDGTVTFEYTRDGAPLSVTFDAIGCRFFLASHFKDSKGVVNDYDSCPVIGEYFKKVHKLELQPHEQLAVLHSVGRVWEDFKKKLGMQETSPLPTDSPR